MISAQVQDVDDGGVGPNDLVEAWAVSNGATSSIRARVVYPDVTRPTFLSCSLDLDANELTLAFDEPVRSTTLQHGKVTLRDASDLAKASTAVALTSGSNAPSDGATLVVALSTRDAARIKSSWPLGKDVNATYCALAAQAVTDCGAGSSSEAAFSQKGVRKATFVTSDVSPPSVVEFTLDLDEKFMTLEFDEPVNVTSVDPVERGLTLASAQTPTATVLTVTCSQVLRTAGIYNATVRVAICTRDALALTKLIAAGDLCSKKENCYVYHDSNFAYDTAFPPNAALSIEIEYAVAVSEILPDLTAPVVESFALDLDTGIFSVISNEIVDVATVDVDAFTLQSARFNDGVGTRTLSSTRGTIVDSTTQDDRNGTSISIVLGRDDLDAVKALAGVGLGLSASSVYVSLSHEGAFKDVAGNPSEIVQDFTALGPAVNFTADTTPPKLVSLTKVSKTRKILYALFSEPVDHESVNLTQWILTGTADVTADDAAFLVLSTDLAVQVLEPGIDGDAEDPADPNAPYATTLALLLNDAYEEAQALGFFSEQSDTYLHLGPRAIADAAVSDPNYLRGDALDAAEVGMTPRATMMGPAIEAFALDMDSPAVLALSFAEPLVAVNESLDVTAITLQSAMATTETRDSSVALTASSYVSTALSLPDANARVYPSQLLRDDVIQEQDFDKVDGDRIVKILLSTQDVWALQRAARRLAKDSQATYLALAGASFGFAPSVSSVLGDPLHATPRSRGLPLTSTAFIDDTTAPLLESYALDLDAGVVSLNFSEPVQSKTLNVSGLRLKTSQFVENLIEDQVTLGRDSTVVSSSDFALASENCDDATLLGNVSGACPYARVVLGQRDFDEVRAVKAGSWLAIEPSVARDTARNLVVELTEATSIPVSTFVKDTTPPSLTAMLLDLDDGVLVLNFSEPVDPTTFNASLITFRNADPDGLSVVSPAPTLVPTTSVPSEVPTSIPTNVPSPAPSEVPTSTPTSVPSTVPTSVPTPETASPSLAPSEVPTAWPTEVPSTGPTPAPSLAPTTPQPSSVPTTRPSPAPTSVPTTIPSSAPTGAMSLDLKFARTLQTLGVRALYLRLYRDLSRIKRLLALNPNVPSIGTSINTTFMFASSGYISDCAFPGSANPASTTVTQPSTLVLDSTGPRLVDFDLDTGLTTMKLYFDEPVDASSFNASSLVLLPEANVSAARVRLSVSSTAVLGFPYQLVVTLSASDQANLLTNGISSGGGAYAIHDGGIARDIIGAVPAVPGVGPYVIDATFTTSSLDGVISGLPSRPEAAMRVGPVVSSFSIDMDSGELTLEFVHDIRTTASFMNASALENGAADSLNALRYVLGNATVTSTSAYGDDGEAEIHIQLDETDLNTLKIADGGKGASPVATAAANTYLGVGETLLMSVLGTRTVPRILGAATLSGVKTFSFTADTTRPEVLQASLDMDTLTLALAMSEPVRAAEVDVSRFLIGNNFTAATTTVGYALTSSTTSLQNGASTWIFLRLGTADANELKRLDKIASSRNDTFIGLGANAIRDRAADGNAASATSMDLIVLATFVPDRTAPTLVSFTVNLEARTLIFIFDEPVIVASFNATGITFQEKNLGKNGQTYRLYSSYAVDTSSADSSSVTTLEIAIEDEDYAAINLKSRLFKDIDSARISVEPSTVIDVAENRLAQVFDGQSMAASDYVPDSTAPEVARFWLDVDSSELTLNFTEPVAFGSFDATKLLLLSESDLTEATTLRLTSETTTTTLEALDLRSLSDDDNWDDADYYGAGAMVTVTLAEFDLNAMKALTDLATSRATTYLYIEEGAFTDMTGNLVVDSGSGKPAAAYTPDETPPILNAFDLDMDSGTLILDFSETVATEFDPTGVVLMAGHSIYAAGGARLSTAEYARGASADGEANIVTVTLGIANVAALKVPRVGTTLERSWLAMDASTISDAVGLNVVRIAQNDVQDGSPLQARTVTPDTTAPALVRMIYDDGSLYLFYDEPVVTIAPDLLSILDNEEDPITALHSDMPFVHGLNESILILDLTFACGTTTTCVVAAAANDTNATTNATTCETITVTCDADIADQAAKRHGLAISILAGAVVDYAGNPSFETTTFQTTPTCTCADDEYILDVCTGVVDVQCAKCSTTCPGNHFISSPCGTLTDIGCTRCTDCGAPFYASAGCDGGTTDTVCTPCTECTAMEYEESPCAAGQNRVCVSCAQSRECDNPSLPCRDAARWWRQANCCFDHDGEQIPCNQLVHANLRISAREERRHWVFHPTFPNVEDGFSLDDILALS